MVEGNEGNNGLTRRADHDRAGRTSSVANVSGPATNVGAAGQPLAVTLVVKNQAPAAGQRGAVQGRLLPVD